MTSKTAGKYRSKKRSEIIANAIGFLLLVVLAAAVLLPIWWIFRSSLMSNASMYSYPPQFFPDQWNFSNYAATLETYRLVDERFFAKQTRKRLLLCLF